jgi:phosphoribosylformimino-5-aminoimidazole carboxamide ribotide isomerase
METVPVIDLKSGLVVHGIGGNRALYRPIRSVLAGSARPAEVARAFADTGAFQHIYIADLDAIAGRRPDWQSLREIAESGLQIWLDAGVANTKRLQELADGREHGVELDAIIVGLESLNSLEILSATLADWGAIRCIFSLDLRDGHPLAREGLWQRPSPEAIAQEAFALGVRRMILLDLATVGTCNGPQSLPLADRLRSDYPALELIGGGGIRHMNDLRALAAAGFSATLVATALHSGAIDPADLAAVGRFLGSGAAPGRP